jgi:two-component system nitrogen regulation sensor histidine kinase NtrY
MVFSRFIWTILGVVVSIVVTSVILGIYLQKPEYPVTWSVLVVLLILETVFLFLYLLRIRRDLLRLILALRNEDPTLRFSEERSDPYFSAIHHGFNEIIRNFRLIRLDREAENRFFEAAVNHIQFGIMAFDREGNVELVNQAFLDQFKLKELRKIHALEEISPGLSQWLGQLAKKTETLQKIVVQGTTHHMIFLASVFRIKEKKITLVSVRDISREIDRNELDAWQKLMRVLRHEILNSITPIKLLSGNLSQMLASELNETDILEMRTGLDTIHRRATGLSRFLDAYSNLYRVPELEIKPTQAYELLNRVGRLYKEHFEKGQMGFKIECEDKTMEIGLDERMIEQVLINLVKNALDALRSTEDPFLILSAWTRGDESFIAVKDNGAGIPEDQLDHIFIPFYSTREEGTGVGLSFSQHIMRLHHGRIYVHSTPGKGSEFQLIFPEN